MQCEQVNETFRPGASKGMYAQTPPALLFNHFPRLHSDVLKAQSEFSVLTRTVKAWRFALHTWLEDEYTVFIDINKPV